MKKNDWSYSLKKGVFPLLMIFIIIGSITSLSTATPTEINSPQGVTLNILTRHSSELFQTFKTAFLASDLATAADVDNVIFYQYLEGAWVTAAQTGTMDIGWGGGPTLFDNLVSYDLVDKMNDSGVITEVATIPEEVAGAAMKRYDAEDDLIWTGAAISSFGFTINKDVLDSKGLPYPKTWTQLLRPEYFSQVAPLIAMGNSPDTTSNTKIYEIILQKFGWDLGWGILTAMAGNSVIKHGSTEVLTAVTNGEVGIGMTIDFYGYGAQLSNPACEYIIPEQQSIVNADPICLIKGASPTKRDAANAFIEFVLSDDGQGLWLSSNINRIPIKQSAFDTPIGATRPDLYNAYNITITNVGIDFDDNLAASYHGTLLYYFQAAITDAHSELRSAWSSIVTAWKNSGTSSTPRIQEYNLTEWIQNLGAPLVDMNTAQAYSDDLEAGGSSRTGNKSVWTAAIKTQYGVLETASLSAAESLDSTNPQISNVLVSAFDNVSATITWNTDEPTTTTMNYGLTTNLGLTYSNEENILAFKDLPVTNHVVDLKDLVSGGEYYFEVSAKDLSGNFLSDDNSGSFYTFTLIDTAAPVISMITASAQNDSAIISWLTDEFSDSRVNYGTTDVSLTETLFNDTEVLSHQLVLLELVPLTTYYFELNSSDGVFFTVDDNDSNSYSFSTSETRDITAPVISDFEVNTTQTSATISFTTDEASTVAIHYGVGSPTDSVSVTTLSSSHEITISGLTADTTYVYYIEIVDAFENSGRFPVAGNNEFTTDAEDVETTTTTTTRTAIPGFDYLSVFLTIQFLFGVIILSKKRKR